MPFTTNTKDDTLLIKAIIEGDKSAFSCLVKRYNKKLFSFSFKYTRDEEASLEIVQDCFFNVFKKAQYYDPAFAVSTWLYNITLNLCRDHKRRVKRKNLFSFNFAKNDHAEDHQINIENLLTIKEQLNLLGDAIDTLPHDLKTALIMFHLEEQSQSDCAEQLGISVKSVEARVYRARKILREKIKSP